MYPGINLRTGQQGVFPEAHVVDVDYNDFDPAAAEEKKERYIFERIKYQIEKRIFKNPITACSKLFRFFFKLIS